MDKQKQAIRQVLDTLERLPPLVRGVKEIMHSITALREALAGQTISKVTSDEHCRGLGEELHKLAEQAEQEPLMITPGGGTFPFAVVGKFEQAEQRSNSERMEPVACKSVPIEPTEDMLLAAELSQPRGYRELYVAMISAAPVQQAEQEPVAFIGQGLKPIVPEDLEKLRKHEPGTATLYDTSLYAAPVRTKDLTQEEIDRLCAAIKAEDDYCVDNGDYMLDSNDCIKIIRGEWVRPDYSLDNAVIAADREKNQ